MTKRFFSLIAVLAISLLTACAQTTSTCKSCPVGMSDCCGACPCGVPAYESSEGKMCDPAMKKKHHQKRHHAKADAGAPTIPASAPAKDVKAKDTKAKEVKVDTKAKDAKAKDVKAKEAPKAEPAKPLDVIEGVKKIIKDVTPKDAKKPE